MDSAANKSTTPQAPLPVPVKRRGRGNFNAGLHCDAPAPVSSEPPSLSRGGGATVLDASILRADDATKQSALPAHLAAFKNASDAAASANAATRDLDIEAESDRLVSANIGGTVREQLFRKDRRRRHIIFVGNMYALAGGLPFGQEDSIGTSTEAEAIAAQAALSKEDGKDLVIQEKYVAIKNLSAEQRSILKDVAFYGNQQGIPDVAIVRNKTTGKHLLEALPPTIGWGTGGGPGGGDVGDEERLYFMDKYYSPHAQPPTATPADQQQDGVDASSSTMGSPNISAADPSEATLPVGGPISGPDGKLLYPIGSPGHMLAKLRRIENRIVCRVQALKREREIGCRVRLIKHRGAKPARLAAKYIMGITLSLDAVAGQVGDEEVTKFPSALFSEDRVLRTLLAHLQQTYGRTSLLRAGAKQSSAMERNAAFNAAKVIEATGPVESSTTVKLEEDDKGTTSKLAANPAVDEESSILTPTSTAAPPAAAGDGAEVTAPTACHTDPVPSTVQFEDEEEDNEAMQAAYLVECQRRVVAMQASLQDGVHPLTVAEGDGGGTEAALETYHTAFYDTLSDEYRRAVGNEALSRESHEDSCRRRDQYDRIAALAARKLVGLTSPVLTSYRFSNLPAYLISELKRLWNAEDIRKQKVTIRLEFGKAYFSTSSSDPVGQLFGQGAKMLGSRGHRFYKDGEDQDGAAGEGGVSTNNPHDKPVFPTLVSKLNSETAQLYYINDAPLTVARAMDLVCARHGKKHQKEVHIPAPEGSSAAPETTLVGPSNCERIKYSSVRIYFFSKLKQTHVVTRAVWDSSTNAFKLVDIEHIGITFSWLMMHLGNKTPAKDQHPQHQKDIDGVDKTTPPTTPAVPFTSTTAIPTQDRYRCLPVELQFRAFHRSKAATSLDTKQSDENATYHPIETKARSILARLTAIEHDRLKYGCSTGEEVYEEAGVTEEMLDSQRVARDYEETILSEGGKPRDHVDIEAAYEITSIVVEHVDTRKILDLGLNLDNADALTIELRPPPRVRNNIDPEDMPPPPMNPPGLVHVEKPYNMFRTRSCNIHWKMDMERRYQQYLQQHDTTSESLEVAAEVMLEHHSHSIASLISPINTAMKVVEEVLAWAEALENDRASLPSVADMMIRKKPMEGYEEGDDQPNQKGGRGGMGGGAVGIGGGNSKVERGGGHDEFSDGDDFDEDEDDEDPFAWGEDSAAMQRHQRGGRGTARGRGSYTGGGGGRGSFQNSYTQRRNNDDSYNDRRGGRGNGGGPGGRGGGGDKPRENAWGQRHGGRGGGRGGRGGGSTNFTGGTGTFRRPTSGAPEPL